MDWGGDRGMGGIFLWVMNLKLCAAGRREKADILTDRQKTERFPICGVSIGHRRAKKRET